MSRATSSSWAAAITLSTDASTPAAAAGSPAATWARSSVKPARSQRGPPAAAISWSTAALTQSASRAPGEPCGARLRVSRCGRLSPRISCLTGEAMVLTSSCRVPIAICCRCLAAESSTRIATTPFSATSDG